MPCMSRLRSFLYSRNHDTVIIAPYMDKNCHRCHLLSLFPISLQKKAFQRLFSKKPFSFLHISLFECAKFAYVSSEYADHFLFILEISRQNLLPRKDLLIILQVSLQKLRCVQSIRTFTHAVSAVEAVFDLHHLRLHLRRELELGRGSSEKERHSRAGVDLNSCRTWHTVAAGTAEASE